MKSGGLTPPPETATLALAALPRSVPAGQHGLVGDYAYRFTLDPAQP